MIKDKFYARQTQNIPLAWDLWIRVEVRCVMLSLFKHIFGSAAHGADPTFREFIKGCIRGDITIGIALFGIVNITADITFPFFHLYLLFELKF